MKKLLLSICAMFFIAPFYGWCADSEVSNLTELAATPAATDELYINDGGTSKKIQYSNLMDGEALANDSIDDDSIDFGDVTGVDLTLTDCTNVGMTGLFTRGVQAKTYNTDDDAETIGTDLTSSVILVTTDNDGANEEVDIQDGTVAGQILTIIVVSGSDDDDVISFDFEEDSTCTGCPGSGVFSFNDPGEGVTMLWTGATWFYMGSNAVAD